MITFSKITLTGEQTYCQKQVLAKLSKIVLRHFARKNSKNDVLVQCADFNFCSSKAPNKAYNKANVPSVLYKFHNKEIFTSEIRMLEKFQAKNQKC
jgi:hypothetical protein